MPNPPARGSIVSCVPFKTPRSSKTPRTYAIANSWRQASSLRPSASRETSASRATVGCGSRAGNVSGLRGRPSGCCCAYLLTDGRSLAAGLRLRGTDHERQKRRVHCVEGAGTIRSKHQSAPPRQSHAPRVVILRSVATKNLFSSGASRTKGACSWAQDDPRSILLRGLIREGGLLAGSAGRSHLALLCGVCF